MPSLPTRTVTFLFTDIEGSTLLQRLGDSRYVELLAEHQRLLRAALAMGKGERSIHKGTPFWWRSLQQETLWRQPSWHNGH